MGVCIDCGRKVTFSSYFNEFWNSIKIRDETVSDLVTILKIKQKNYSKLSSNDIYGITFLNSNSETNNKENIKKVFNEAEKEYTVEGVNYYIIFSLFMLCKYDIKKLNLEIENYFREIPDLSSQLDPNNKNLSILSSKLIRLMKFHINLISLSGVDYVFSESTNKKDLEERASKIYSKQMQDKYFENNFKITSEYIEIKEFLEKYYRKLSDDAGIRADLLYQFQEEELKAQELQRAKETKK